MPPPPAPDATEPDEGVERMELVLPRSREDGLSQEPAYQRLKEEGWSLEMAFLVRSKDRTYDQYHLTLRRPLPREETGEEAA